MPNPFYGVITDPQATNLNGKTVQFYRLLRNMPQYDGASGSDPNTADSIYHGSAGQVGEALLAEA